MKDRCASEPRVGTFMTLWRRGVGLAPDSSQTGDEVEDVGRGRGLGC